MAVILPRQRLTLTRCSVLPYDHLPGVCAACGKGLVGRQTRWCSRACQLVYPTNHYWTDARAARIKRDGYRCVRCNWADVLGRRGPQGVLFTLPLDFDRSNWLEVNHRIPRNGRGYGAGCHHHQDRLETLCHRCHVKTTTRQRVARVRRQAKVARRREVAGV
jgi:hypothetical protein